jgi:hypothetical protein
MDYPHPMYREARRVRLPPSHRDLPAAPRPTPPGVVPCAWQSTKRAPEYPRAHRGLTCSPFQPDPGPDHRTQAQTLGYAYVRHLLPSGNYHGVVRRGHFTAEQKLRSRRLDQPDLVTAHNRGPFQYNRARTSGRGLPRGQYSFGSVDDGPYLQTIVPFGMRVAGWPFVLRQ